MGTFEKTIVYVEKDDVLQSKKGFFLQSPLTEKYYVCKKVKILGKGIMEVLGEKEEVNLKQEAH